jgi:hypothetical protein
VLEDQPGPHRWAAGAMLSMSARATLLMARLTQRPLVLAASGSSTVNDRDRPPAWPGYVKGAELPVVFALDIRRLPPIMGPISLLVDPKRLPELVHHVDDLIEPRAKQILLAVPGRSCGLIALPSVVTGTARLQIRRRGNLKIQFARNQAAGPPNQNGNFDQSPSAIQPTAH